MNGSIRAPYQPLERGSVSPGGRRSLLIGAAAEVTVGIPAGVLGVMSQWRKLSSDPGLPGVKVGGSVLGWVGSVFSGMAAWQEASGVRSHWARLKRRSRLGMSRSQQVMALIESGAMVAARGGAAALPLTSTLGLLEGLPIGPVLSTVTSTVKVARTARDLAAACRFSTLMGVVKAKKSGGSADPMLTVLDRLRGEVAAVVTSVNEGLKTKLNAFGNAEQRAHLIADAQEEIGWILRDRVGDAAAAKLLALAKLNSTQAQPPLEGDPDSSVGQGPETDIRAAFDGIENLYRYLLAHKDELRGGDARSAVSAAGEAKNLADAVIHALRQDAHFCKRQAMIRFGLAMASLFASLLGLAALFTPAGPAILLAKAAISLAVSLLTLSQLPWDIATKRAADTAPLASRLEAPRLSARDQDDWQPPSILREGLDEPRVARGHRPPRIPGTLARHGVDGATELLSDT